MCVSLCVLWRATVCASASLVRHIYVRPHTGVGRFSKVYGGNLRRGVSTSLHVHVRVSIWGCLWNGDQDPIQKE